ncbi:hypothetical protein CJ026_026370 [Ralstonia pickettii]|uniref:Ldh family oxidoreductase n=1 Tax=Ralstonia pickettii TaxID=329 RepID=UPI000CD4A7F1|nr:hypothetical protein CJ026_026370 [Ralstonia pickettii]
MIERLRALEGAVLPFAGPKGSGLAMGIEFLCGTLLSGVTGARIGDMYEQWDRPQRVGHFFIAIDPAGFGSRDAFDEHVREFVAELAELAPAEGHDGVKLPGQIEADAQARAEREGVALPGSVVGDLEDLAAELGIDARLGLSAAGEEGGMLRP